MYKKKNKLSNIAAIIYFLLFVWIIIMLPFIPIGVIRNICIIATSGFGITNSVISVIGISALLIGISLLVPAFRRIYYALPWLFSYVKILFIDGLIMCIATLILNYGYEINNDTRHIIFFTIMIVQIIICRALMCIYFYKKPVKYNGEIIDE